MRKLNKKNIHNILQLTSLQEGILFHYLKNKNSKVYCIQLSLCLIGNIIIDYFHLAWNEVVRDNEMLRTIFRWEKLNNPIQIVLNENIVDIQYFDLSKKEQAIKEEEFAEIKKEDYDKGFDLQEVPFRLTLVKVSENEYKLLISTHHILYDGWSSVIIINEFAEKYQEYICKKHKKIKHKTSFKDFVKINRYIDEEHENYWRNKLASLHTGNLFRTTNNYFEQCLKQTNNFVIAEDKVNSIKDFCNINQITISDLLYSLWAITLFKFTGYGDIVFGTTISGRDVKLKGINEMVGLFINTIPFKASIKANQKFSDFVKENSNYLKNRKAYENLPLQKILEVSHCNEHDLFESVLVVENFPFDKVEADIDTGFVFADFEVKESTNYKLVISIFLNNTIEIHFNSFTDKVESDLLNIVAEFFCQLLSEVCINSEKKISELVLLSEAEKDQLLYEFNKTSSEYPREKTIIELFEEQVLKNPSGKALLFKEGSLSYEQLWHLSNNVASLLRTKGVRPGEIVGIMSDKSPELLIGIFGILKAGCAYLPILPDYPVNRIKYILKDSGAKILLSQESNLGEYSGLCETLDLHTASNYTSSSNYIPIKVSPEDLAYVIYTSGTSGLPKGVLIEHHSVINRLHWMQKTYPLHAEDVLIQKTSIMFDVSVWELFWWSLTGSTLALISSGDERDPKKLLESIHTFGVSVIHFVPSMLDVFLSYIKEHKKQDYTQSLRYVFSSGEALHVSQVDNFFETGIGTSGTRLINLYGPTEATVDVSYFECEADQPYSIVPIGKPIDNIELYILDGNSKLQPIGLAGELCISGVGLARGYLSNPELTAEKFVCMPSVGNKRLYRTGDLARWLPDGNIEFLGRIDSQVKIRGFRIELGEIESVLLEHQKIKEAAVIVHDHSGEKVLCGYIVGEGEVDFTEIREYLSRFLPEYMIPSYFTQLPSMPLTSNGKLDRKSLPSPEIKADSDYVAPSSPLERTLVSIWSEVLNIPPEELSIHANFFAIGGHSLKATILKSKIHKELDVDFPLRDIFIHPTIQTQALQISQKEGVLTESISKGNDQTLYTLSPSQMHLYLLHQMEQSDPIPNIQNLEIMNNQVTPLVDKTIQCEHIVLLKKGKDGGKNIFIIHDESGDVNIDFCSQPSDNFNYWGVCAGELKKNEPINITIEYIAEIYLKDIRKIQPDGEYNIMGWSIGGFIAFELARKLEMQHTKVSFLGIVDIEAPFEIDRIDFPGAPEKLRNGLIKKFTLDSEYAWLNDILSQNKNVKELKKYDSLEILWLYAIEILANACDDMETKKKNVIKLGGLKIEDYMKVPLIELIKQMNFKRSLLRASQNYKPDNLSETTINYFGTKESVDINLDGWENFTTKEIIVNIIDDNHYFSFDLNNENNFYSKIINCLL